LKALFLKNGHELDQSINYLLTTNFPQLEVIATELGDGDIVDFINEAGQISLIVINVDHQPINLSMQLEMITEYLGTIPMVFICSAITIKTHLTEKILNSSETNFIINLPLRGNKVTEAVEAALSWVKETEFQQSVGEFSVDDLQPMRIKSFFIFQQIPYDVYLQLTTNKFGKIIQGNRPYSHQQIQLYSQKGVKYLYLKKDEQLKFLTNSIKNLSKYYEAKNLDRKRTILLHQQSVFFIREFIQLINVSDEIVDLTQLLVDSCAQFLRPDSPLEEIIDLVIQNRAIDFAQQTLLTIYISRAILLKMTWNSDMALGKIALAAILQDIHLDNDEFIRVRSINDSYLKTFTDEEQQQFLEHPERAAVIARIFNGFSEVDFILLEHHERPTGDGFPKGINASSLTAISCIFILVTNIVAKIAQNPNYSTTVLRDIVKQFKTTFSSGNFKEPFKSLEKIIKEMNG
jgi:response regulator RpfG family c-di-GMP phosphodiesterase